MPEEEKDQKNDNQSPYIPTSDPREILLEALLQIERKDKLYEGK